MHRTGLDIGAGHLLLLRAHRNNKLLLSRFAPRPAKVVAKLPKAVLVPRVTDTVGAQAGGARYTHHGPAAFKEHTHDLDSSQRNWEFKGPARVAKGIVVVSTFP